MQMVYSTEDVAMARSLQFSVYLYMSIITFWTYDYACSLREEWTFLLRSRWTKVKGLYIITRYVPFVVLSTDLYLHITPNESIDKCLMVVKIYSCFSLISVACSEYLFVLRTYALWNKNKFVLAAMLSTFFAFFAASIGISFATIATSHFATRAIPGITGCYQSSRIFQSSIPFLLLFVFQLGLVSLTLIRAMHNWWATSGPLYATLVKHSVFYYACGLFLSAMNVLMLLLLHNAYNAAFKDFQFVLLAILATRMHLHLWHIDQRIRGSDTLARSPISDMSSVNRIV